MQMRWAGCAHLSFNACHTVGTVSRRHDPARHLPRRVGLRRPAAVGRRSRHVARARSRTACHSPAPELLLLDSYGGAINRVHPNATAFVHRGALFCIQYITYNWGAAWLAQTRGAMRPHVSGFCYQNYIDATLRNWQHAYYGSNYRRLQAIRRRVDPQHRFNFPQAIGR